MDTIKFSILIPLLCLCISCEKEQPLEKEVYPEDCAGYSAAIYKVGYAHAEGSYQDFGDYAIFARERIADTVNGGWMHDPVEKSIILASIDESCAERMMIGIKNIRLILSDPITLKHSSWGLSKDFPTASLGYMHADAGIETYHLVTGADNWLIIDKINSDTTEIEGRFNLSFVTAYDFYLNDERERWDDPNRPDTLRFTNGEFRAVYRDF